MSLLEIAILNRAGKLKLKTSLNEFFNDLQARPVFHFLPLTLRGGHLRSANNA